ncbi:MAG: hypothetical protein AAF206_15580 [Bacteroidota bacterium]
MNSSFRLRLYLIGSIICLLSCQTPDSSIRNIAAKYLDARLYMNFAAATQYVSEDSKEVLEELEDLSGEYLEDGQQVSPYKIIGFDQDGNKAVVTYAMEGFGEAELELVAENGDWKVQLSPNSVPDEGLLIRDLQSLESEDSVDTDTERLDAMLMKEDEGEEELDSVVTQ